LSPSHIYFSLRIIPAYRSPYGGACVAHTNGPTYPSRAMGPGWHVVGRMLEPDKKTSSPLLYHLGFIVGLTERDLPSVSVGIFCSFIFLV
jgi:hypothetical protein